MTFRAPYTPDNQSDFGLMAKWSPEWLQGTLGVYYRKTSDILPNLVLQPTAVGSARLISGNPGCYNQFYVDDSDVYGISLSKSIKGVGVGVGVAVNYRCRCPASRQPSTRRRVPLACQVLSAALMVK